jgi:hypothetical protein
MGAQKRLYETVHEALTHRGWSEHEANQIINRLAAGYEFVEPSCIAILPFGKHKGQAVENVPPSYLTWLVSQDWFREKFFALYEDICDFMGIKPKDPFVSSDDYDDDDIPFLGGGMKAKTTAFSARNLDEIQLHAKELEDMNFNLVFDQANQLAEVVSDVLQVHFVPTFSDIHKAPSVDRLFRFLETWVKVKDVEPVAVGNSSFVVSPHFHLTEINCHPNSQTVLRALIRFYWDV